MLLSSCGKHEQEPEKGEAKAAEKIGAQTESRVSHGTNGEVIITLDADTQKKMGLAVAPVMAARMAPEAKGYGRVQDMSWLGSTISDLQAARIAANAAQTGGRNDRKFWSIEGRMPPRAGAATGAASLPTCRTAAINR